MKIPIGIIFILQINIAVKVLIDARHDSHIHLDMIADAANFTTLAAERLANFQVGTTDVDPRTKAPAVNGGYSVCATVTSALRPGESRSLKCVGTGRYVIVQLKGRNYLTLCEVIVLPRM